MPGNKPRVSVIIPTYNRSRLLREALNSVLGQTYANYEIIVVDDGSTDDTSAVLDEYAPAVRCLRQPNRGVNAARNAALMISTGDYIAPLDSDDLWEPFKLELMVGLMERFKGAGFCFSNFFHLRGDGTRERDGLRSWHRERRSWQDVLGQPVRYSSLGLPSCAGLHRGDFDLYPCDVYGLLLSEHWVNPCSALIRRAALLPGEGFPEHDAWSGEMEFFARLSHRAGALFVDLETVLNRSHSDTVRLTHMDPKPQLLSRIRLIDRLWAADSGFMEEHADEVWREQARLLLRLSRLRLIDGYRVEAKESIRRLASLRRSGHFLELQALRAAAALPGSAVPMRMARALKRFVARIVSRRRSSHAG